jgi:hypothetical protein
MLDAARNIANAVLGEGLRRLDLMRESKAYFLRRCHRNFANDFFDNFSDVKSRISKFRRRPQQPK